MLERLLAHVHGHLGWLAVAVLAHPAFLLRRSGRRAAWAVGAAVVFALMAWALGAMVYPAYRSELKPLIFRERPDLGWLFERKEHLAVLAAAFAVAGALVHFGSVGTGAARRHWERVAHHAFVIAFVAALATAVAGTTVAVYKSF